MRKLRVVRADPAGNITLFVLTPVGKVECAAVAAQLMAIRELQAEQVGFIFPNGHMEMEAGEFCGNASRAYGFLLAKQQGLAGCRSMQLSVSGCDHPITVTVDMDAAAEICQAGGRSCHRYAGASGRHRPSGGAGCPAQP